MKVIKNFLDKDYFKEIQNKIMGGSTPFFYSNHVAETGEKDTKDNYYFTHLIFQDGTQLSPLFQLFVPFLKKIECKALIRMKVNLFPRTEKVLHYSKHFDENYSHKGCLFSINTCDGGTQIGDTFIKSVANQALFFDSSQLHNSTTCTNQKGRFNVNLNYF